MGLGIIAATTGVAGATFGVLSELTYNERNALAELPAGTTISGNQVDVLEGNYRTQVNSALVFGGIAAGLGLLTGGLTPFVVWEE